MNSCYWKSPKEIGNLSKLEELFVYLYIYIKL